MLVEHETLSVSSYQAAFGSISAFFDFHIIHFCLAGTQIAFDASLDTFHDPSSPVYRCIGISGGYKVLQIARS